MTQISWAPKWSTLKLAYRTFFLKTGDFCPPCSIAITSFTYRLARTEKISLIVLGFNPITDINPKEIEIIDQRLFKDVIGTAMNAREKKDFIMFEPIRLFIRRINLPAYVHYNEKCVTAELENALQEREAFSGKMHFDCLMSPIANWLRRRKWGFDKNTQKYSALVRDGQITRDEALQQAERSEAGAEPEVLTDFMEMLDLTRNNIERARELSPLNFKHYNSKLIRIIGKLTRIIDKDYK